MTFAVGIDVGGTKIAAGVVAEDGTLLTSSRSESPAEDPAAIAREIAALVAGFADDYEIAAVGVAAAGWINLERTEVMFAPNLAWRDEPLRDLIAEQVGLPTVIENDANAAAWGEYRFGSGQGARSLLTATIGTGIGGGIVLGGQVFRGGFGVGAEIGHIRVVPAGRPCACGELGCWEAYGSGTGLTVRARELAVADPSAATVLLTLAENDPEAITGPMVSAAAEGGDPVAARAFAEVARWIGEGLASLTAVLDPDVIVIGGGVSESAALPLPSIVAAFEQAESGFGHRPSPRIERAALGNDAGLIGAADLARIG
ncbi:MAG: ROK family glucokinase [Propionibacteriales bacterium]|nr:ROK family glucokinase [Propionibacteriales bacterium]